MIAGSPIHPTEDDLHALADGTLAVDPRAAIARHVAECTVCAALVDRVRGLLAVVDAAPRTIDPPEDLWPAIRRRTGAPWKTSSGTPRSWRSLGGLAAAAVVLVALSSTITWEIGQRRSPAGDGPAIDASPSIMTVSDYDRLDRELATLLASQRKALRPETIATVERNLAVIDQAIAEIRTALIEDPGNRVLHDLLKSSYGQKAALLRQVSQT
jgi:hypothetical protein